MCGRYNLITEPEAWMDAFGVAQALLPFPTNYNIAPGQTVPAIVQTLAGDGLRVVEFQWGLVPSWAKDKKIGHSMINARSETLIEKPSFKSAFRKKRCLIPTTGFYEWQKTADGKQAYHICREDRQPFAFAGLWEHWERETESLYTCTIITAAANAVMAPIHERMPVILSAENYNQWLDAQQPEPRLIALLGQSDYTSMIRYPISNWVNNPRHNDRNCLEPISQNL